MIPGPTTRTDSTLQESSLRTVRSPNAATTEALRQARDRENLNEYAGLQELRATLT